MAITEDSARAALDKHRWKLVSIRNEMVHVLCECGEDFAAPDMDSAHLAFVDHLVREMAATIVRDPRLIPHPTAPASALLRYFAITHLPAGPLRQTSALFAELAAALDETLPNGSEKSTALRKLLEAKDAAVRAALDLLP